MFWFTESTLKLNETVEKGHSSSCKMHSNKSINALFRKLFLPVIQIIRYLCDKLIVNLIICAGKCKYAQCLKVASLCLERLQATVHALNSLEKKHRGLWLH